MIEIISKLPYGWSCDTQFEAVLCSEKAFAKNAWRMKRIYRLISEGEDTLGKLLDQYVGSPSETCKSLRRLVDRGLVEQVQTNNNRETNRELAIKICSFMNELLKIDRQAISSLCNHRVECNASLADHESVQVGAREGVYKVGCIGLFNGLCGKREDGWGLICALFDEDEQIVKFDLTENYQPCGE